MPTLEQNKQYILENIRVIENWPEPGVAFRDITTLLQNPLALQIVVDIFVERYSNQQVDVVVGLDARGFIFGPIVAYKLGCAFVPIRKKGKLPYKTFSQSYTLEYGDETTVEMHIDAVKPGDKVVVIDDLIATGGTMLAACNLIKRLDGEVVECAVINNLTYLNGSKIIETAGFKVFSILDIVK